MSAAVDYWKRVEANKVHAVGIAGRVRAHLLPFGGGRMQAALCGETPDSLGGWTRRGASYPDRCQECVALAGACQVVPRGRWPRPVRERAKRWNGRTSAEVRALALLAPPAERPRIVTRSQAIALGRMRARGFVGRERSKTREPWCWFLTEEGARHLVAARESGATS